MSNHQFECPHCQAQITLSIGPDGKLSLGGGITIELPTDLGTVKTTVEIEKPK